MTRPRAGVACKVFSGTCTKTVNRPSRQITRAKTVAGDESRMGGGGEPARVLAGIAVDAGKGFRDDILERAGQIAGERAGGIAMDARKARA